MYILITYDVDTTTKEGARRLRHVAKACLDYGQRVQNSVFECEVTEAQYCILKDRIKDLERQIKEKNKELEKKDKQLADEREKIEILKKFLHIFMQPRE